LPFQFDQTLCFPESFLCQPIFKVVPGPIIPGERKPRPFPKALDWVKGVPRKAIGRSNHDDGDPNQENHHQDGYN
jgi:hypothetical protein